MTAASGCLLSCPSGPEMCSVQKDVIKVFLSMIDVIIFHQKPWLFSHNPRVLTTYSILHSLTTETSSPFLFNKLHQPFRSSSPCLVHLFVNGIHGWYPSSTAWSTTRSPPTRSPPPPPAGLRPGGPALRRQGAQRHVGAGAHGVPAPAWQRLPPLRGVAGGRREPKRRAHGGALGALGAEFCYRERWPW